MFVVVVVCLPGDPPDGNVMDTQKKIVFLLLHLSDCGMTCVFINLVIKVQPNSGMNDFSFD